jgi:hypothetical protein
MSKLGKRLIKAAKSAQAIARGDADPSAHAIPCFPNRNSLIFVDGIPCSLSPECS